MSRYSMPSRCSCSISSATNCASSWPEYPVKPTIFEPAPSTVKRFFGLRSKLFEITAFAASRIVCVDR